MNEREKQYYLETKKSLHSDNHKFVRARLNELKSTGTATLLPLILDFYFAAPTEELKKETFELLGNLRDQSCAPILAEFVKSNANTEGINDIISVCWQSRLDFSEHLESFTSVFIIGDYQASLECFTVIEEMVWKAKEETLSKCRTLLSQKENEISTGKKPLFNELVKILEEGKSQNQEDHPELYD